MEDIDRFSEVELLARQQSDASRVILVDYDDEGHRLDALIARAANLSRTQVQDMLTEGYIRYLGPRPLTKLKSSLKVSAGDRFLVSPPPVEPLDVQAEDIPLDIVHEDGDLVVVNKARGMVVHPATGVSRGTLVNALLHHVDDLSGIAGVGRPGIVHRLDKDTSGLMVIAKNDAAHSALTRQFAGRTVNKVYLTLVHGKPSPSSVIDMPIGRHPMDRKRMAVVHSGRPAVTEYERVETFAEYSLLRVRIRTGRTHQIRVHLAWLGHPVAGDPVYCRRDPLELRGQFLHAARLAFVHPTSGEPLAFEQPLPQDLDAVLRRLRVENGIPGTGHPVSMDSLRFLDGWQEAASGVL